MPTLSELHQRFNSSPALHANSNPPGESLICDYRTHITPTQAVESKLGIALLRKPKSMRGKLSSLRSRLNPK